MVIVVAIAVIGGLEVWRRAIDPARIPHWVRSATWVLLLLGAGGIVYTEVVLPRAFDALAASPVERASVLARQIRDAMMGRLVGVVCAVAAAIVLGWATWYARKARLPSARVER